MKLWNRNILALLLDISMSERLGYMTQTSILWATEILRNNGIMVVYREQPVTSLQLQWNTQFHLICRLLQEGRTLVILISVLFLTDFTSYKIFFLCLCIHPQLSWCQFRDWFWDSDFFGVAILVCQPDLWLEYLDLSYKNLMAHVHLKIVMAGFNTN